MFNGRRSHEHLIDTDFVVMTRSDLYGETAERKVIHPKKHLNLRFPALAKGTFRQTTEDTSAFHTPFLQVWVEACDCITADGCEGYLGLENGKNCTLLVSQCVILKCLPRCRRTDSECCLQGRVMTTSEGGFEVACMGDRGSHHQGRCTYTGSGEDVLFTVSLT